MRSPSLPWPLSLPIFLFVRGWRTNTNWNRNDFKWDSVVVFSLEMWGYVCGRSTATIEAPGATGYGIFVFFDLCLCQLAEAAAGESRA